jgi:hypothetical protein
MNREEAKELFRNDKDAYGKPRSIMHKIDQIFDDFEKECSMVNTIKRMFENSKERKPTKYMNI